MSKEDTIEYLPANKGGRPSKFEEWMVDKIKEIAQSGGHQAAMCLSLGISEDTFYRWKKEIPEFKHACEEAKLMSKAFHENLVLLGLLGKIPGYNHKAMEMIMHNKFEEYKITAAKVGGSTEITINQLSLAPNEIDAKIARIQEKLKSVGIEYKNEE